MKSRLTDKREDSWTLKLATRNQIANITQKTIKGKKKKKQRERERERDGFWEMAEEKCE